MIVNSSRGGGSKDTWVLEDDGPAGADRDPGVHQAVQPTMPGLRYGGAWQGQQQQQQQQELAGRGWEPLGARPPRGHAIRPGLA
jgi:hypothetical protein